MKRPEALKKEIVASRAILFAKVLRNGKKVMCIPPIIEDNIFVTNFEEKAVIFNDLFVKQCSLMVNESQIPESLPRKTQANLTRIDVPMDKIVTLVNQLNCSKANGCDDISIRMLKLCARECSIPLKLIYDLCLETAITLLYGKWQMWSLFIRRVTVRLKLTIDQYLSFQYVAKFLKKSSSMKSINTCLKITLFPLINLAFVLGTLPSISSCL